MTIRASVLSSPQCDISVYLWGIMTKIMTHYLRYC